MNKLNFENVSLKTSNSREDNTSHTNTSKLKEEHLESLANIIIERIIEEKNKASIL